MQYLNQINSGNSHFPNFQFVVLFDHFALWACAVTNFFHTLFSFGVLKRRELEVKGSGVATQTGSGRVLSSESMNKLRV